MALGHTVDINDLHILHVAQFLTFSQNIRSRDIVDIHLEMFNCVPAEQTVAIRC